MSIEKTLIFIVFLILIITFSIMDNRNAKQNISKEKITKEIINNF